MTPDPGGAERTGLVIGGTRFIGRHLVTELLDHEYDVAIFNRGRHANPFAGDDRVRHVQGDRRDRAALVAARAAVRPDIVIDCIGYHPDEVRTATEVFADVQAYVYVSSGGAYAVPEIPKREDETPLHACTPEQARDDTMATYGPRKAEGDRAVFAAAEDGVNAMSVRPTIVYGPHDYMGRFDYWINRVCSYDELVVPGDGTNIWHRVYVEDVASALRLVAECGEPGRAYNCADQQLVSLAQSIDRFADAADTTVEQRYTSPRELATADLTLEDFPVYRPNPHILSTRTLEALGWTSTPLPEAIDRTVEEFLQSERDGTEVGPTREREVALLGSIADP